MSKQTILIVGTSFRTLRKYLLEHGFEYVVLKDILKAKSHDKKLKRRVLCDFSSRESMLKAVDIAVSKYNVSGVIAIYENYILPAAQISEYLELPGLPVETAKACTDKFLMRQKFLSAPQKISPDFAVVNSEEDVRAFAANHTFPLILKPANLAKSLLVFKNNDLEELISSYRRILETMGQVYAKYAPRATPKILIEEFMEGSVHSVEAFVDTDGTPHVLEQVVDYQTGYDIGYDDNFHYSRLLPSALPDKTIADIRHTAELGCRALGMKNSPAHIEIILTKYGPRIVEIGARNGGYRERMHQLANGIDITGNTLRIALGQQPKIHTTRNDHVGVFELFPKQPGTFRGISNEEGLRSLPSLSYYSVKATPGAFAGKSSDGYKMSAVVILHNNDPVQFASDLDYLNSQVRAITI